MRTGSSARGQTIRAPPPSINDPVAPPLLRTDRGRSPRGLRVNPAASVLFLAGVELPDLVVVSLVLLAGVEPADLLVSVFFLAGVEAPDLLTVLLGLVCLPSVEPPAAFVHLVVRSMFAHARDPTRFVHG